MALHLLSGLYDSMFSLKEYKVLLVGLDESGKTSVLERIKYTQKQLERKKNGATAAQKSDGFAGITANLKIKPTGSCEDETKKEPKLFSETPIDTTFIKPTIGLNICKLPGYTTDMEGSNTSCNMLFWDLGGKEPLRTLWYNYTHQCHAVVLVVDASDRSRFPEVKKMAKALMGHPSLGGFDKDRVEAVVRSSFSKPEEGAAIAAARQKTTERFVHQAKAAGTVPILVLLNKLDVYLKDQTEQINGTSAEIHTTTGTGGLPSLVNLFDETGLLEVALDTSILPDLDEAPAPTKASSPVGEPGSELHRQQHPLEIATTMKGSVGVGQRLFKVCPISALYEEEAIREANLQLVRSRGLSHVEVAPLADGLDWLVQYLAQNARHVESL